MYTARPPHDDKTCSNALSESLYLIRQAMKLTILSLAVLPAVALAAYSAQEYASGEVHNQLMSLKQVRAHLSSMVRSTSCIDTS